MVDPKVFFPTAAINMQKLPDGMLQMRDCKHTRKQLSRLVNIKLKKKLGLTDETKLIMLAMLLGRDITSTDDLYVGEAVGLVEALK